MNTKTPKFKYSTNLVIQVPYLDPEHYVPLCEQISKTSDTSVHISHVRADGDTHDGTTLTCTASSNSQEDMTHEIMRIKSALVESDNKVYDGKHSFEMKKNTAISRLLG